MGICWVWPGAKLTRSLPCLVDRQPLSIYALYDKLIATTFKKIKPLHEDPRCKVPSLSGLTYTTHLRAPLLRESPLVVPLRAIS